MAVIKTFLNLIRSLHLPVELFDTIWDQIQLLLLHVQHVIILDEVWCRTKLARFNGDWLMLETVPHHLIVFLNYKRELPRRC